MKIDFSAPIKDFDGKPLIEGADDKVTLGTVAVRALNATFADEQNLPAEQKMIRFRIALKASDGGEQDLSTEDAAELKKVIGRAFTPLIVGRAFDLIEGSSAAKPEA